MRTGSLGAARRFHLVGDACRPKESWIITMVPDMANAWAAGLQKTGAASSLRSSRFPRAS